MLLDLVSTSIGTLEILKEEKIGGLWLAYIEAKGSCFVFGRHLGISYVLKDGHNILGLNDRWPSCGLKRGGRSGGGRRARFTLSFRSRHLWQKRQLSHLQVDLSQRWNSVNGSNGRVHCRDRYLSASTSTANAGVGCHRLG
jgi:hypothetical protein